MGREFFDPPGTLIAVNLLRAGLGLRLGGYIKRDHGYEGKGVAASGVAQYPNPVGLHVPGGMASPAHGLVRGHVGTARMM